MSKIVEKLAEAGALDQDALRRIESTVAQFEKLAEEDPEFHFDALEKLGFLGLDWKSTGNVIAATALATGGAALAQDVYRTAKNAIVKTKNYKAMLDANPDLRQMDSKAVQRSFNTLHNFNPQYASDPHVAGEFVKHQTEREGVDLHTLQSLVSSSKAMGSRPSPFEQAFTPQMLAQSLRFKKTDTENPFTPGSR